MAVPIIDLRVSEFACDIELARSLYYYNFKEQQKERREEERQRREEAIHQAKVDALAAGRGTGEFHVVDDPVLNQLQRQRDRRGFVSASYNPQLPVGTWYGGTMVYHYQPPPPAFTFERHNGTRVAIPNP